MLLAVVVLAEGFFASVLAEVVLLAVWELGLDDVLVWLVGVLVFEEIWPVTTGLCPIGALKLLIVAISFIIK